MLGLLLGGTAAMAQTAPAADVKVTAPAAAPAAAATAASTLKRLNIRGDRPLVIELLKDKQAAVRPPAGAFRIWVQQLLNPLATEEVYWELQKL